MECYILSWDLDRVVRLLARSFNLMQTRRELYSAINKRDGSTFEQKKKRKKNESERTREREKEITSKAKQFEATTFKPRQTNTKIRSQPVLSG